MDMKVKSSLIRKHRTERMWSQEQLADISGLGLRTIQRLESRGNTSFDTIKALAAVFEVEADSLVWRNGSFEIYRHKQRGSVMLIAVPLVMLVVTAISYEFATSQWVIWLTALLCSALIIPMYIFSSMTIEVNESDIIWFFGSGFHRKSLPLEEVASCKAVKNPIWMGFGIHAFGTGWIYNVSGLLGIEIELKGGAKIRLGSDEPNYLVQAIEDAKTNVE